VVNCGSLLAVSLGVMALLLLLCMS